MKNKITFKDKVIYMINILKGKLVPFLKSEIQKDEIEKTFNNLRKNNLKINYKKKLLKYLGNYYKNNKEIYLTNSGRDALYYILLNLNLKKKEILIPSYSCLGLIEPILQLNLKPSFVDIDHNLNPSFESIKKAISNETSAVIIPHLGGTFARDTSKIIELCKKNKIIVIEDCCQAFGLLYENKNVGTFADISFFSSGIGKPIFTPAGGWIVTKKNYFKEFSMPNSIDDTLENVYSEFLRFNSKFSGKVSEIMINRIKDKFQSILDTYFYNMPIKKKLTSRKNLNNLSAYIILKQIKRTDEYLIDRKKNASYWIKILKNNKNVKFLNVKNSIFNKLYVDSNSLEKKKFLLGGIEVENGYTPLHLRYNFIKYKKVSLTNTNKRWKRIFSLPVRPYLFEDINLT